MKPAEAIRVLAVFERADNYESLTWRVKGTEVKLFALCNDFFHLATGDLEEIEAGDIALLEQCLADLPEEEWYLAELFAARKRKMRPHASCYKGMSEAVRALFDACSTEQEREEVDRRDRAFWAGVARKVREEKGVK